MKFPLAEELRGLQVRLGGSEGFAAGKGWPPVSVTRLLPAQPTTKQENPFRHK